jgi:hypothetical protein
MARQPVTLQRIATNRTLIDALRNGAGPLTSTQRYGFFLFGCVFMAGGCTFVFAGPAIFRETRELFQNGPFAMVLSLVVAGLVLVFGLGVLILGLRLIRHVVLKTR